MSDAEEGYTWLDAAVDEESVVECTAEDLELDVPLRFGEDAPFARWRFDGSVSVHVDGLRRPLAEWLRMWGEEVRDHEDRLDAGEAPDTDGGD